MSEFRKSYRVERLFIWIGFLWEGISDFKYEYYDEKQNKISYIFNI